MARRGYARRAYRSRGGIKGFGLNNILYGAIAEAGADIAGNFLGRFSRPVVYGAVGWFSKNPTIQTIAGMELGNLLSGGLGGLTATGGGGAFEG